jgi:hypothetical protein
MIRSEEALVMELMGEMVPINPIRPMRPIGLIH